MKKAIVFTISMAICLSLIARKGPSRFMERTEHSCIQETFLEDFPYAAYVLEMKEEPLSYLVNDVLHLKENKLSSGIFLDSIFAEIDQNIENDPQNLSYLKQIILIGEGLMFLDDISLNTFPAFGDVLLQRATNQLEEGLEEKQYSLKDPKVIYLLERLQDQHFFVKTPINDWQKGWNYLMNGDWSYLIRKVRVKQPLLFYSFLSSAVLLMLFSIFLLIRKRLKASLKLLWIK